MDPNPAEGWYRDPYGIHEQRWFSGGRPSALVRDEAVESNDPPPGTPLPETPVRALAPPPNGDDLRRAGDGEVTDPHDAAMSAWGTIPHN
ncbi:MAG TPA: hypothetical protein VII96_13505 [Acidimicrobiales bacterium]